MRFYISHPSPKKYDNPSEKVRKTSGDLDDTKKALVFTTGMIFKQGNYDTVDKKEKKPNVMKESATPPISEKIGMSQSTKQRNHKHPINSR